MATLVFAVLASGALVALAAGVWWNAVAARTSQARRALALGVVVGLLLGALGGIGALTARGRWRCE